MPTSPWSCYFPTHHWHKCSYSHLTGEKHSSKTLFRGLLSETTAGTRKQPEARGLYVLLKGNQSTEVGVRVKISKMAKEEGWVRSFTPASAKWAWPILLHPWEVTYGPSIRRWKEAGCVSQIPPSIRKVSFHEGNPRFQVTHAALVGFCCSINSKTLGHETGGRAEAGHWRIMSLIPNGVHACTFGYQTDSWKNRQRGQRELEKLFDAHSIWNKVPVRPSLLYPGLGRVERLTFRN